MLDAVAKLLPPATKFLHQIAPSVIATLIAAGLISGYNHAFSGHVQQPRMAALKTETDALPVTDTQVSAVAMTRPAVPATDYFASRERVEPARVPEKEASGEVGKDQSAVKVAVAAPQPRPTNVANPTPRTEPRAVERHVEPRVASVPYVVPPAPATVAPPPLVAAPAALPPPVIMAAPPAAAAQPMQQPMVPDRPRPPYEQQAEDVPPPPQGPIGAIVNTLKPSSLFARAREFGERIEAAGNEILPNIRQ